MLTIPTISHFLRGREINRTQYVKYLGVIVDHSLNCREHFKSTGAKAIDRCSRVELKVDADQDYHFVHHVVRISGLRDLQIKSLAPRKGESMSTQERNYFRELDINSAEKIGESLEPVGDGS